MRKLQIDRKAYTRKGYKRKAYTRKGGVKVKAARVAPSRVPRTRFKIKDVGAPGRGKKYFKVKKGRLTTIAKSAGLLKEGQKFGSLSKMQMRRVADIAVRKYGAKSAKGMFQAQEVFRKRMRDGFKGKVKATREYIGDKYSKQLVPRAAIRKWKSMSPAARAKAMPGGSR